MPTADEPAFRPAENDSWRTWLITGVRRQPPNRRRVRGSHVGLKRMLAEGMKTGDDDAPYSWRALSDAMVRQSVGEGMRTLPSEDAQLVKLAYLGGFTNRELAARFRITESAVQRRLRQALGKVSEYAERGRSLGRRVVCAAGVWLSARWLDGATHQVMQAGAFIGAAAILVAQPSAPSGPPGESNVVAPAAPLAPVARDTSATAPQASQASPAAGATTALTPEPPAPVRVLAASAVPRLLLPDITFVVSIPVPAPPVSVRR